MFPSTNEKFWSSSLAITMIDICAILYSVELFIGTFKPQAKE